MQVRITKTFKVLTPGNSLKRRVAYGLAVVRLILAPVIFLTIYYLFEMGTIVNRIVNINAPATTLAEQISVEMLQARRNERNYFLLNDPIYLQGNRRAVDQIRHLVAQIGDLEPTERSAGQQILTSLQRYEQQFGTAVALLEKPGGTTTQRAKQAVAAYEADLNDLLRRSKRQGNAQLAQELQSQVVSFDSDLAKTLGQEDPTLRLVTPEIQATSQEVLRVASQLETQSWEKVEHNHDEVRRLLYQAEWVLSIVSVITFLLSVWISFVIPRAVVKPLVSLKDAVDHAASGNNLVEFELEGKGEIVDLARSIDNLIHRLG
jgi:methyl-accepting chemotaxis protein